MIDVPDQIREEQKAVEQEIRQVFKGVTREGGTSWSEGWAIDNNGSEQDCAAARASDTEPSWEALVDDPNWYDEPGCWPFLDAIGFRYYLPAAMIRCAREIRGEFLGYALEHPLYEDELRELLTTDQLGAISRFLQFMQSACDASGNRGFGEQWRSLGEKWNRS